jgi:hypothetical protein
MDPQPLGDHPHVPKPPPQPAQYGPASQPPTPHYVDPLAPYGRDPVTGNPLSSKSKLAAGVLQFLWGGPFGAGNLYLGDTQRALLHIAAFWGSFLVVAFGGFIGAFVSIFGFMIMFLGAVMGGGSVLFAWFETFLIFTDKMFDKEGRQLK